MTISYDGTGFISMNETVVNKTFGGMSNGNVITAFTVRTDIGIFAVCNGSVSSLAQNVSAHVTLPFSYGTASYTISHMIVGATMSGPAAISGNKSTSGFDIQNLSPQAGNINVEWHTVGAL
ncbi:hypothetical protein DW352_05210 [Pseudolabrys taiwanensis]|uniref:Uncharacterized protein n=1 Tax=Pseudolabrys taiwanensis TaxID=331696 RepID=A0A345ZSS1_9HYPH|nr:hypothetical protein [Pseudolabrys taiwanensis]AXK79968.1 hypothetical protein DW352_05210 [Pseudolabrys taiwanensis]